MLDEPQDPRGDEGPGGAVDRETGVCVQRHLAGQVSRSDPCFEDRPAVAPDSDGRAGRAALGDERRRSRQQAIDACLFRHP